METSAPFTFLTLRSQLEDDVLREATFDTSTVWKYQGNLPSLTELGNQRTKKGNFMIITFMRLLKIMSK